MTSKKPDPWKYMGPAEVKILGDSILDPEEQARWCRAILFGSLPYMWLEQATVARQMMFENLRMKRGDRVLVIGECIEECQFDRSIREAIGSDGELTVFDIAPEARAKYMLGARGRSGLLATWPWHYTESMPDNHFDAVAVLQAIQHTDDWAETGSELLRVLKSGCRLVLSEITFGPNMINAAAADLHLQTWLDKIFSRMGWTVDEFPYYSPTQLHNALDPILTDTNDFSWKGVDLFWGTKP